MCPWQTPNSKLFREKGIQINSNWIQRRREKLWQGKILHLHPCLFTPVKDHQESQMHNSVNVLTSQQLSHSSLEVLRVNSAWKVGTHHVDRVKVGGWGQNPQTFQGLPSTDTQNSPSRGGVGVWTRLPVLIKLSCPKNFFELSKPIYP